jgi:uncharacterized membrane protein
MRRETPPVGLREMFLRADTGRSRVLTAAATGVVVAFVVAWFAPWQLTILVAWDVVAVAIVATVWLAIGPFTPEETRDFAQREDSTRAQTHFLLLGAALVSLVGVVLAFLKANQGNHENEIWLEGAGIATIACSWLLVHTVFMLRYAHVYYTPPIGGVDFKMGPEEPDYRDFAYMAFTIGMTFQVSDTDITSRPMRRQVLRHALVSFLFGSVILATTVNVVAGLLNN